MFANYLRTGLRNLIRNRLYSAINIVGLAVGLASCLLILMFMSDELSFDRFWDRSSGIYRLHARFDVPGRDPFIAVVSPGPAKHALVKDIPEIETAARISHQAPTVRQGDDVFVEDIAWVDAEFFDIFDLPLVDGSLDQSRGDNSALIVTRSFAEKYFGSDAAVGRVLTLSFFDIVRDYKVAAVVDDLPDNTVLSIEAMVYIDETDFTDQPYFFESWTSVNTTIFFKLRPSVNPAVVQAQFDNMINSNFPDLPLGEEDVVPSDFVTLSMMNVADLQLHAEGLGEMKPTGDIATVTMFGAVAVLILVVACINFMNLSTARSTQRTREVSMRKVVGARRGQLIGQFLGESVLLGLLGYLIALGIVALVLPWYNDFVGKTLSLAASPGLILAGVALAVAVGVGGGLYPAFYLSRFRPAEVLKANQSSETTGSARVRTALVIVQFSIAAVLVVCTAIVYGQSLYAQNKDLGFQTDNMLAVHRLGRAQARPYQEAFHNEVRALPGVLSAARSDQAPPDDNENNTMVHLPGVTSAVPLLIGYRQVDEHFFPTYRIPLIAGRNFERDRPTDMYPGNLSELEPEQRVASVILNESAVRRIGLGTPAETIGRTFEIDAGMPGDGFRVSLTVIGVVPDVHFQSLKKTIRPEMYAAGDDGYSTLTVRFENVSPIVLADQIQAIWSDMVPDVPYLHSFVDQALAEQYEEEQRQATLFAVFSVLAVFVACLGLYGLASFTVERRTREIGIRKVMGASVRSIVTLLLWQFSRPVIVAHVIAWPVALYLMNSWLQAFVYRIDLWTVGPLICIGATAVALVIAWLTVSGHAWRVAQTRPALTMRYE